MNVISSNENPCYLLVNNRFYQWFLIFLVSGTFFNVYYYCEYCVSLLCFNSMILAQQSVTGLFTIKMTIILNDTRLLIYMLKKKIRN